MLLGVERPELTGEYASAALTDSGRSPARPGGGACASAHCRPAGLRLRGVSVRALLLRAALPLAASPSAPARVRLRRREFSASA